MSASPLSSLATLSPRELDLSTDPKVIAAREKYRKQVRELETGVALAFEDKELLLAQLSHFVLSERQQILVQALEEAARYPGKPVREILLAIPMSPLEFMHILKEVRTAFSDFSTKAIIDAHRPKVVEAVMKGALPKTRICLDCNGVGKTYVHVNGEKEESICKACFGEGKITKQPEHERQITALEVAGVLKKGSAAVEVNVNNNAGDGWRNSPDFRRESDKLMYSAVDAVVVTSSPSSQALPENLAAEDRKALDKPEETNPDSSLMVAASTASSTLSVPEETPVVPERKKREKPAGRNMFPYTMDAPVSRVVNKPILVPKK